MISWLSLNTDSFLPGFVVSGLGCRVRVWPLFGPLLHRCSHVGHAGVGVLIPRSAPLVLPTFAAAQLRRFFDYGRVVRCLLPVGGGRLGGGRFLELVVLCGYQGADDNADAYRFAGSPVPVRDLVVGAWHRPV